MISSPFPSTTHDSLYPPRLYYFQSPAGRHKGEGGHPRPPSGGPRVEGVVEMSATGGDTPPVEGPPLPASASRTHLNVMKSMSLLSELQVGWGRGGGGGGEGGRSNPNIR